jgi:hypothetical protein
MYANFRGKSEGKKPPGILRHRCDKNIYMILKEIGFDLVATKNSLSQNFFCFISTLAANTLRVFRPSRSQQNAQ